MKLLIFGVTLISLAPVIVKTLEHGPGTIGFVRNFFGGGLILLYFISSSHPRIFLSRKPLFYIILAGLFFGLDMYSWNKGVKLIGVGLSTLLANTQIFYVTAYDIIFEKEKISKYFFIGLFLSFLGIAFISKVFGSNQIVDSYNFYLGIVISLLAGIFYSISMVFFKKGLKHLPKEASPFAWGALSLVTGITLLPVSLMEQNPSLDIKSFGLLFTLVLIVHTLGWLIITSKMKEVRLSLVGIILLVQPALALLWGALFFGESYSFLQAFGTMLVFFGLYLGMRKA